MTSFKHAAPLNGSRIDSWKDIAAFFGRDERTVKRWEKERGLPVHRLPGRRGGVFAYSDELIRWSHSTSVISPLPLGGSNPASLSIVDSHEPAISHLPEFRPTPGKPLLSFLHGRAARSFFVVSILAIVIALCLAWTFRRALNRAAAVPDTSSARSEPAQTDPQEFYLRARYYRNLRTRDGLTKAVDAFTQAVVRDSNYAPAYAGLAESYVLMPEYGAMPRSEAFPRAIAAANKALALDPNLPQAHAALAFALFYWDWNVPKSFAEYRRALELDPRNVDARHWYATSLLSTGNVRESLAQIRQAQQIDPASRSILADEALIEYSAGDRLGAIAKLREIEREEPDFLSAPSYLSRLYLEQGDYARFVSESKRVAATSKDPEAVAVSDAAARGWSGRDPRKMLEQVRQVQLDYFEQHLSSGFDLARTCALLGRVREAVKYLRAAYADRDYRVLSISLDDWTSVLQDDPDFKHLQLDVRKRIDGTTANDPGAETEFSTAQTK